MRWLTRIRYRIQAHMQLAERLSDRARVEALLHDCANGKRPLPTKEDCRNWAVILGVPKKYR